MSTTASDRKPGTQTKTTIMSNLTGKTTIVVGGPRRGGRRGPHRGRVC
jgi:hypothetical protein